MQTRVALLGLVLAAALGGGAAGVGPVAGSAAGSAQASNDVQPLQWTIKGNIIDYLCPDTLAPGFIGLQPDM